MVGVEVGDAFRVSMFKLALFQELGGMGRWDLQASTAAYQAQMRRLESRQRILQRASCDNHATCASPDMLVRADEISKSRFPAPELVLLFANREVNCFAFIEISVHHSPDLQRQLREKC